MTHWIVCILWASISITGMVNGSTRFPIRCWTVYLEISHASRRWDSLPGQNSISPPQNSGQGTSPLAGVFGDAAALLHILGAAQDLACIGGNPDVSIVAK
ncbi:hypothetical protein EDC04DRAFT_2686062 [Pisolithus marmoratus]|nr:hypothetical protein EDC04DRAFT_2686062 [Pisolithus marmoratus]